jgi:Apea-like HEPN
LDYKISKKDKFQNIKAALHRFNYAYQESIAEDRIIDHVIALEALFSKHDDPTDSTSHIWQGFQ